MRDWRWLTASEEGQFLERKSCYDRSAGTRKRRDARGVGRDVAETLAAMANADGGILVLGMEDDGTATGVPYPEDRLDVILRASAQTVLPPLRPRHQWVEVGGVKVLTLEVDWSPETHRLTDGRYILRVGDRNMPFPAADIAAMKEARRRRVTETRPIPEATMRDLDPSLFDQLRAKTGLALSDEELLRHYRLAEPRDGQSVLSLAAVMLFANDPLRWHPACYVDFVKWEGKERRFGADLNVVKRQRVEAPLPRLIEQTFQTIWPHIRERHRLVDLFFEERYEYPTFAWQEAVINAIAHRDYAMQGTPIEVWLFDDRMEVRSPGMLMEPVTVERLVRRERIHASRNPRIVRVLTDLGYMRELGEGVPRIFQEMEREGLRPPEFLMEAGAIFAVTLRNTPVYPPETLRWMEQFHDVDLSPNQKRALAYAHAHNGQFTSRSYQKLVGIDPYTASRDLTQLVRKGIIRLTKRGGRIYEVLPASGGRTEPRLPRDLHACLSRLPNEALLTNDLVRQTLGVSRGQATRLLRRWTDLGYLDKVGTRRWSQYRPRVRVYETGSASYESSSSCQRHGKDDS